MKDTEVNQREILKMIKNLSSKINSLSDKTLLATTARVAEPSSTEPGPSSQREDIYELPQNQGQHTNDSNKQVIVPEKRFSPNIVLLTTNFSTVYTKKPTYINCSLFSNFLLVGSFSPTFPQTGFRVTGLFPCFPGRRTRRHPESVLHPPG